MNRAAPQERAGSALRLLRPALLVAVFIYLTWFRIHGISTNFQLEGDQIRDWVFAIGRASDLPLAGAPSMAGGRGLGPIYYWLLWLSRVTIGPFVDNLPHAGGIGLSIVQSVADVVLLSALWKRLGSVPFAVAVVLLIATSPLEAAISASVWNPQVAIAFTKITIALVLTDEGDRSRLRHLLTVACAWFAIQAHSSAWPAVLPAIAWLVLRHLPRRRFAAAAWAAFQTVAVISVLQVPFVLHRMIYGAARGGGPARALGAMQGLLEGNLLSKLAASALALGRFLTVILFDPWPPFWMPAAFLLAAAVLVWRETRGGFEWLVMTVIPLVLAVVLYAPMRDRLDYWYVALAPATAVMLGRALTRSIARPRWRAVAGCAALCGLFLAQGCRYHQSRLLGRVPQVRGPGQRLTPDDPGRYRSSIDQRVVPPSSDDGCGFPVQGHGRATRSRVESRRGDSTRRRRALSPHRTVTY